MNKTILALVAGAALTVLAGCDSMKPAAAPMPAMATNGVLTAPSGMTLYTFDKDIAGSGASTCNGPCAALWPPLTAKDGDTATGAYTVLTRADGTRQWAYKGLPLYTYSKDMKSGDMAGDNFKNVWHAAKS